MSRCFPFPPPGYEKKPRSTTEQGDLLAKEKRRERKHKKEKDKERGGSKERKDKGRSKDKHKEKDKKEKRKDNKKDKDRDRDRGREKDKNRTSEDRRTERLSEVHHADRLGYDSRKAVESRDSKFTEDFGRRIRDDEKGAATRMVEDFSATAHRRVESMGASTDTGKESVTGNKMVTDVTGTAQRRNEKLTSSFQKRTEGMGTAITMERQKVTSSEKVPDFNSAERRKNENLTHPTQKRIESMGTATAMEKQRAASNDKFGAFSSAEHRRNHATGQPTDNNIPSLVQRRTEGKFTVDSMQMERAASNNNMVSNSTGAAAKKNDGMERPTESRPMENLNPSVSRRIENIGAVPAMEKERPLFLNITGTEQKTDAMGPSVVMDAGKKTEGKEKIKEKKTEDGKRGGHKDRDRKEKKRKEKDKDQHKEKKKEEKKMGKSEHKLTKHDKLRESGVTDQVDNLIYKSFTPYVEDISTAGADGNSKKRKVFESNGFLHEPQHVARPNKLPRTSASSHPPVENGRPLELVHNALPCDSAKLGAVNNTKMERGLDDNGNHLNGKTVAPSKHTLKPHISPVVPPVVPPITPPVVPPVAPVVPHVHVDSSKNDQLPRKPPPPKKGDQVPLKPPHPDTKYLGTIYSVPKLEEFLESDDQEWLFSSENPRSRTKVDATPPQVWATGLQIEAADVFALPYVIPF